MRPRILLVATSRWLTTARLAMALTRNGCDVHAVCPAGHAVERVRNVCGFHRYRATAPVRSIAAAIAAARPDCIIPCDDFAAILLYRLCWESARMGETSTCALIERSIGPRASFPILSSRTRLIKVARELGIRTASTDVIRSAGELSEWVRRHGLPAVLKADGTSGGRGVRIVHSPHEAADALSALSSPPSPARAIKRALVNQDTNYLVPCLQRIRPVVSAQAFVAGQDANCTVACWNGQVLAGITVGVIQTLEPAGPASVVKVIENAEIAAAAEKVVRHLRLSGLLGFDFVLQEHTGNPQLIEMNARATQTGHLQLGPGKDLPGSLRASVAEQPLWKAACVTSNPLIAYFPQEWARDPTSRLLSEAHHDVPWDEPDLIRIAVAEPWQSKVWTRAFSMASAVRSTCSQAAFALHGALRRKPIIEG